MNFFPDQIIRNRPLKDGSFNVFMVKGHILNMIEVREVNPRTFVELLCETEFWAPEEVELFSYESLAGTISIGDKVECFGLFGEFVVKRFEESSNDEILAVVSNGKNEHPWFAHFVKTLGE
jgi:hypothetical protein